MPEQEHFNAPSQDAGGEPANAASREVMAELVRAARVERRIVMDDTPRSLTPDERIRIRTRAIALRKAGHCTNGEIAKGIDISASVVSQTLGGSYSGSVDKVLRDIDAWMAQRAAVAAAPKDLVPFGWVRVAEELRAVAKVVVELGTIGVVTGPAGIGKTATLEQLVLTFPAAVLLTITDSNRTVASFFKELAGALGVNTKNLRTASRRAVCGALAGSGRLLCIDECQHATWPVLNATRQIHDQCKIPVLLCGTPSLLRTLLQRRGDDDLGAQVWSRIGVRHDLLEGGNAERGEPIYSRAEIRALFAKSSLRITADGLDVLAGLANLFEEGAMRVAIKALHFAAFVAKRRGVAVVDEQLLMLALGSLVGKKGAATVATRLTVGRRKAV